MHVLQHCYSIKGEKNRKKMWVTSLLILILAVVSFTIMVREQKQDIATGLKGFCSEHESCLTTIQIDEEFYTVRFPI